MVEEIPLIVGYVEMEGIFFSFAQFKNPALEQVVVHMCTSNRL